MVYGMTDDEIVEYIEDLADQIKDLESKLARATCFQIAEDVFVEKRGEEKWCVQSFGGTVVDRDLNRHYEPMPSNRTEEFIAATRFNLEEAFEIAKRYNENGH
jgi:hypothetical protein